MDRPDIAVIVPTYKECENVSELARRVFSVAEEQSWELELLFVDDASPDGTADVVRSESAKYSGRLRVLERKGPRGLAASVLDGIAVTLAPVVVTMDADLSHPPESLPCLVEPIRSGRSRFVIGSRYVAGGRTEDWGFFRRLNSRAATLLAWPLTGVNDPMAGFFAFSRDLLNGRPELEPAGYKIGLELLVKLDPEDVLEVPITFRNRSRGKSKMGLREQADR